MNLIEIILLALAAAPLAYYAIAIFSVWRFFRNARSEAASQSDFTPAVSNLKPIRGADPDAYANFIARRHVDLITVRDPSQSAAKLFNTDMWPETYLIDRNGVIRSKYIGPQDWSDPQIRAMLKSL